VPSIHFAEPCNKQRFCSERTVDIEERSKEGNMKRFIGYIVTFAVMTGMGVALPRWFEWRRSLIDRLLGERGDAAHV
jgi:hypothetical protein